VKFMEDGSSHADVTGGIKRFVRVGHVQEMMGNSSPFLPGRLGRAKVHIAVNLHGIGVDDFTAQAGGQFQGNGRLTHGGGAREENDRLGLGGSFHGGP